MPRFFWYTKYVVPVRSPRPATMDRPENHFTKLRYEALGRLIDSWMAMDDMATSQIPAINAIVNSPLLTIVFMYAEYAFFRKVNLSRGRYSATRSSL